MSAAYTELAAALASSDDLLRRLSEWDAFNPPLGAPYGDATYWQGEIDNARTLNRSALAKARAES